MFVCFQILNHSIEHFSVFFLAVDIIRIARCRIRRHITGLKEIPVSAPESQKARKILTIHTNNANKITKRQTKNKAQL